MSERLLVIDAGAVLTPLDRFSPGRVVMQDGVIEAVGIPSDVRVDKAAERIEAPRLTLVPGFIEPHIHGAAGVDAMDATFESLNAISRSLVRHGTTSFLPTTVSSPPDVLGAVIERLGALIRRTFGGARPLGIHLEGPFISVKRRGAHRAANVLPANALFFAEWNKRSHGMLKLITLAPELDGAGALAHLARSSDVVVAMGHSDASYTEALAAIEAGTHYAVHTFNAMREFTHRDSGVVGAVLADNRVFAEIIADGIHVSPEVVRIFSRAKAPNRVLLVSDGISATDMPDGHYVLGGITVDVVHGVCRDGEGRLAGSTLTQEAALKNFIQWTGMRLDDALLGLTLNPAQALKLERRGVIETGAHADMTMLDEDLRVMKTFVEGRLVFEMAN